MTVSNTIFYEQPLGERIRMFLRIEHLFRQASYTMRGFSVWDSRSTLTTITAIIDVLSRSDLKTEMLKELERLEKSLTPLVDISGVDKNQLTSILKQLEQSERALHGYSGQLASDLRQHELLNSIRQRSSVVGGTSGSELPLLHFWLQQEPELRIEQLESWMDELDIIRQPVDLILGIIRESSVPEEVTAEDGFYQQNVDASTSLQLIRVGIDPQYKLFPEISAGKQRFSIRFMQPQGAQRPVQFRETVPFLLSCCAL